MNKKRKHYAWPTTKEESEHMKMRQLQNRRRSKFNRAENWMHDILKETSYKWTRQARWGIRLYDFWCHRIGVAVEVDGKEHVRNRDFGRDKTDYEVSGIKVIRVRNFSQKDADKAKVEIGNSRAWNERRTALGLKPIRSA